ncbi:hypothetical protein AB0N23_33640, partial [Streptomyces sp. NPDC052644]
MGLGACERGRAEAVSRTSGASTGTGSADVLGVAGADGEVSASDGGADSSGEASTLGDVLALALASTEGQGGALRFGSGATRSEVSSPSNRPLANAAVPATATTAATAAITAPGRVRPP